MQRSSAGNDALQSHRALGHPHVDMLGDGQPVHCSGGCIKALQSPVGTLEWGKNNQEWRGKQENETQLLLILGSPVNPARQSASQPSCGPTGTLPVPWVGSQAKTILLTHLQQTNRFIVMDRANMAELQQEAQFAGAKQNVIGAKYVVTGDVTEFGRKQTGDKQLFGLLGKGKAQVAYAKVALNIVDVETSAVVFSVMGAGEFSLENREVVGFGGTASYDATLNGKVLDLAMREAVNNLVEGIQNNQWQPQ